jgi:hypothetical protein
MGMANVPSLAPTLTVPVESGQFLLYDPSAAELVAAEAAFDDVVESGRFVGVVGGGSPS